MGGGRVLSRDALRDEVFHDYQEGEEVIACLLFQALADKVDHGCLLFLHRALGDAEEGGDFGVLQALLEVELEDAAVSIRELVDGIVEEVEGLLLDDAVEEFGLLLLLGEVILLRPVLAEDVDGGVVDAGVEVCLEAGHGGEHLLLLVCLADGILHAVLRKEAVMLSQLAGGVEQEFSVNLLVERFQFSVLEFGEYLF